jgi:hypothetical protein
VRLLEAFGNSFQKGLDSLQFLENTVRTAQETHLSYRMRYIVSQMHETVQIFLYLLSGLIPQSLSEGLIFGYYVHDVGER